MGGDRVHVFGRVVLFMLATWTGAVGLRSVVARGVAGRAPGRSVPLQCTPKVIDIGPRLWRGPAPSAAGYAELASAGVTLVVDLRSEADVEEARAFAAKAGVDLLLLPSDDGRVPLRSHVEQFAQKHETNAGVSYVHCRAGEGRTGALLGAYQVARGDSVATSISDALAVGSLTFAQLTYVATAGRIPLLPRLLDWSVDRPTEFLFDVARRRAT